MTADQIVASLRAKSPGAVAELLDSYGDQLFRYCWCMLRSRDIAQIALRDTLVVAEANIARLAEPELLGSWLYALARMECLRRRSAEPYPPEDPWWLIQNSL
jgi:DNA-directed RNA polymerase specialized sigma24 family protein